MIIAVAVQIYCWNEGKHKKIYETSYSISGGYADCGDNVVNLLFMLEVAIEYLFDEQNH